MAEAEFLLDGTLIRQFLVEVAELLDAAGPKVEIVVVGGSLMALHDVREATRDVDSIRALSEPLRRAAASVAQRHGLPATWLNDRAAAWWPAGLTTELCSVELEHGPLVVLAPPWRYLFVMKLEANRIADQADLRRLWPLSGFTSAEEAAALWHQAYPLHEPDPYLATYIRRFVT